MATILSRSQCVDMFRRKKESELITFCDNNQLCRNDKNGIVVKYIQASYFKFGVRNSGDTN